MLTLQSFLQGIYQRVKSLVINVTRKMYRNAAVIMTGAVVTSVVTFNSLGFGGGGRNALAATGNPAAKEEPNSILVEPELILDLQDMEIELPQIAVPKIQPDIQSDIQPEFPIDVRSKGRRTVGSLLARDVIEKREIKETAREELEQIKIQSAIEEEERRIAREKEAKRAAAVIPYSDEDYQILLRIVQAEAGICDDKGKILVANVIINRVKDKKFPGNIKDVVYQPSQFSPVGNGAINKVKVTAQTIDCVERALAGEDYSQGALYFMYRNGSQKKAVRWFDNHLTYLFRYERHEFFK